jgi:hypothetical protein
MKGRATISVSIRVDVEVDVEWDRRSRQATILGASLAEQHITPRKLYEAMGSGEYASLDSASKLALGLGFDEIARDYSGRFLAEYPDVENEIRGLPESPVAWGRSVKKIYGAYVQIPVPLLLDVTKNYSNDILIEVVLCKVPTVYVWNVNPAKDMLHTLMQSVATIKDPSKSLSEDGSLCLRWNR